MPNTEIEIQLKTDFCFQDVAIISVNTTCTSRCWVLVLLFTQYVQQ